MATMEELAAKQIELGKEMDRLYRNFKKDSSSRKTLQYLETRLEELEGHWQAFQENIAPIAVLANKNEGHPYFTKNYEANVKALYDEYKTAMLTLKQTSEKPGSSAEKAGSSTQKADTEFELTYNNEESDSDEEVDDPTNPVVKLIRRQKSSMNTVTALLQEIENKLKEPCSIPYCEYKMEVLRNFQMEIYNNNQLIWEHGPIVEQHGYKTDYYIEVETWLQDTMIALQEKVKPLVQPLGTYRQEAANNNNHIRLPKISLPSFDGNYLKWTQFRDLYVQLIHHQTISNAEKMFYLVGNLTGEALKLIQHLPVTNQNYESAWSILCTRYDNKRLLVTTLLNKLLGQQAIQVENATNIKNLHDITNECLMGLKNLGIQIDTWDPILIHILTKKLDKNTHTLYEQSLIAPRELNSLQGLLEFLETRFQSLETIGAKAIPKERFITNNMKSNVHHNKNTSLMATKNMENSCILCQQNHLLYACKTFLAKSPADRYQLLKVNNLCINCLKKGHGANNCTMRSCTKCTKKHNTLVHFEENEKSTSKNRTKNQSIASSDTSSTTQNQSSTNNSVSLAIQQAGSQGKYVFLSTVIVKLIKRDGSEIECRAILDSGSQLNLITRRLAQKLALNEITDKLCIKGIGEGVHNAQNRINIAVKSRINGFSTNMEAYILPKLTDYQPTSLVDTSTWAIPNNIQLADPNFHRPQRVDMLIGAEHYYEIMSIGQIKLGKQLPTLQNTVFGWVVAGKVGALSTPSLHCGILTTDEESLDEKVERFWKLEESTASPTALTIDEMNCEEHFRQTVQRDSTGRIIVKLPFVQQPSVLGESKDIALSRFRSVERRLKANPELKQQYIEFMEEYIQLGHMEEINIDDLDPPYYFLPHHCVLKPDSTTTKLRVVFDGSAKTTNNVAINEILHTGPKVQEDLFSILLRFRLPRFVFTADIEKMYRQILVDPDDRKFQVIWWRDNENKPMKCYRLRTVTYGLTTAPYLAIKSLHHIAQQNAEMYPLGSKCLRKNLYVDDAMAGSNSLQEALMIQEQLNKILQSAGFKLRKWCANHPALLQGIPQKDKAPQLDIGNDENCSIKTLGLTWHPKSDEFEITTTPGSDDTKLTKRKILSEIAQIFDPLGLINPIVVTAKIFFQQLWTLKLHWDAAIPMELHTQWVNFRKGLNSLNIVKLARHVGTAGAKSVQLHAFCDASEKAYGAVIYVRSVHENGIIRTRLLCAKSRVAPVKSVTLPRLELCGAKLAAELLHKVKIDLSWQNKCFLWTDSSIVLGWINSTSTNYQTFVANRVAAIQSKSIPSQWRHVPTKENPADLISRGVQPQKFKECSLWFYGPIFLSGPESAWPLLPKQLETTLEQKKTKCTLTLINNQSNWLNTINHKNSWTRLQRIIAFIVRFTNKIRPLTNKENKYGSLSVDELENALMIIIKELQQVGFKEDLKELRKHGHTSATSDLATLHPFLDKNGVIRIGGRLEESSLSYDAKHPMLLPYAHPITRMIFTHEHFANAHIGPQSLLCKVRQRFWIVKGKTIARNVVQNCVRCAKSQPRFFTQLMGNLPASRVQPARPFINSGVDFCGPFFTHFKLRGKRPVKSYVAIFCCFATKAVHIEVVSDLTTEAFLGALKRFIGRRGNCKNIYCDNATNFTGAKNQLQELQEAIFSSEASETIQTFSTTKSIDFHFIPPRSPHFGGLWEAAVKSAKHLFKRSVAAASLTYEELSTIMVEIEAILNSRPLTPLSNDPNDLTALTPGHFLIGEALTTIVDPLANPVKGNLIYRWKVVSHLKSEFWQRWTKEYLSELQHRYKWTKPNENIKHGQMVVLKEDNVPVLSWPLGRIINTIKGKDGLVRVADVRTSTGVLRRPIHRLAPLPVNDSSDQVMPSADEPVMTHPPSTIEEEINGQSKPKRARICAATATNIMLICLFLPLIVFGQITTKPFNGQPGLYFEGMGSTYLTTNEWNLVIFIDMETYWQELSTIEYGIKRLEQICQKMPNTQSCDATMFQFLKVLTEIKNANELLLSPLHNRHRRSPLDIIGNIANSLFGVLDSEYANHMSDVIRNLDDNQQHLLDLLKNQTTIIESTTNVLGKSVMAIQEQLYEFDLYINQTTSAIHALQKEFQEQRIAEVFNEVAVRLTLTVNTFQRTQAAILDVVIHAHHGKVNPILLTPNQLRDQITLIKEQLPLNFRLPAANNHLLELYNLMTIENRITENGIIFRVRLPLLTSEAFEMFNLVPVPISINGTHLIIKPSTRFLIVNLQRDIVYPLSREELQQCVMLGESTHICKQHQPLYRKGSRQGACELSFLTQTPNLTYCEFTSAAESTRWIQLIAPNQWIYVLNHEELININCENRLERKTLKGCGIITISPGCTINDERTTLQARNVYSTMLNSSFIPSKNITDLIHPLELAELTAPSLSRMNLTKHIENFQNGIRELQRNEKLTTTTQHHQMAVAYIGLIIIITAIISYLIWRKCRTQPKTSRSVPTTPAALSAATSAENYVLHSVTNV